MLSAISAQSWYPWQLFLDREKTIRDEEIIRKIIRKTVPDENFCKILDAGCADGNRLKEAANRNPFLQGVGLVRREEDIPNLWKEPAEGQQVKIMVSEIFHFRAPPEFDLMYLFEWLTYYPEKQRMEILQYCKMLLKPGGSFVTAAAKNSHDPESRPGALQSLLKRAGFYKVRSYRLTAFLRLLTAERINKNL